MQCAKATDRFNCRPKQALAIMVRSLLLVLLTWIMLTSLSQAAFPGINGRIAFSKFTQDCDSQIFSMSAFGLNDLAKLSTKCAGDNLPAWSPDGRKLAFMSSRDGNMEIYTMNADGSNQRNITNSATFEFNPAWSPDGRMIVYERDNQIYTMNADGSFQRNISRTRNNVLNRQPAWSPDGRKIAFSTVRPPRCLTFQIYTMEPNGANQKQIRPACDSEYEPAWSPDGSKIAFTTYRDIYTMSANGFNKRNITNDVESDFPPDWSPQGDKIVYMSIPNVGGNAEIFTIDTNGENKKNITNSPELETHPSWQPIRVW